MTHWTKWPALMLAALLGWAMPALAQNVSRFGNITVTCDDATNCAAVLPAEGVTKTEPGTVLFLARQMGERSRWTIALSTLGKLADRDRPVSLSVDNGVSITLRPGSDFAPFLRASDFYIISQSALDRLMLRMQAGTDLRFSWLDIAAEPHTDRFKLDGLRAALTEIDKRQKRITGDRRAGPPDLPPPPDVNPEDLLIAAGLPPRLLELHYSDGDCEDSSSPSLANAEPIIAELTDPAMFYAVPCYKTGDRVNYRIYVYEMGEIGGIHRISFATYSDRFGWMGTDVLEAVSLDGATNILTATDLDDKGCGTRGVWEWDQFAFKLKSFDYTKTCAGKPVWTPVFP